ncbi:hypothetical protein L7F22_034264 [Adiantum nelumboides]|nr:hypothetical protein [Adiantum nelumboides]
MRTFSERSGNGHSREMSNGRKGDLGFRGMLDISDVIGTELGGTDFQLTFAQSPSHVSAEKWSSRLVRQYVTSDSNSLSSSRGPPTSSTSHCTPARLEKARFLENLWRAQALHKTRDHRSHVRCLVIPQEKRERERNESASSWPGDESARRLVYWNVYGRRSYLTEPNKSSIVLHVDLRNDADPLPFGPELIKPHAQMRISSVDDQYGEAAYTTSIKGRPDDDEQLLLSLSSLASRLDDLNADACVSNPDFQPTTPSSQPSTPASHRGRVVTGLENFGRNLLFGTPGSIRSAAGSIDVFGSPAKRTKSTMSNLPSLRIPIRTATISPQVMGSLLLLLVFSSRPADAISQVEAVNEHTPKRSSAVLGQNAMDWEASPGTPSREHLRQRAKSTPARDVTDQQLAVAQSSGARDLSRSASRVLGPRDLTSPPPSSSESPARATSPTRRKPVPTQLGDGKSCPSLELATLLLQNEFLLDQREQCLSMLRKIKLPNVKLTLGLMESLLQLLLLDLSSPQRTEKEREHSRPSSPLRNNGESRRPRSPNHHPSERAPNVPQKDDQDGRTLTQEELTRRVLKEPRKSSR